MKLLIKFQDNWADEFDVDGFYITDKETWEEIKNGITEGEHTIRIGTNEEIHYRSKDYMLDSFVAIEITDEEAETLRKLLGYSYGFFDIDSENW